MDCQGLGFEVCPRKLQLAGTDLEAWGWMRWEGVALLELTEKTDW